MKPTSSPSYDFLDDSNAISNFIRSSPITLTNQPPDVNLPHTTNESFTIPDANQTHSTNNTGLNNPIQIGLHTNVVQPSPSDNNVPTNTCIAPIETGPTTDFHPEPIIEPPSSPPPRGSTQPPSASTNTTHITVDNTLPPAFVSVSQIPSIINVNPNPDSVHPMSYKDAFNDPNWLNVMSDEYNALLKNNTWTFVPRPTEPILFIVEGVDVDETFSPVVKQVYMHQPPGFRDSTPDYVCLLQRKGTDSAYLLLYVDDIVLTASSEELLQRIISSLHQEISMTDLGHLNYFLGISVTRDASGMFLSQRKYASEILEQAHMVGCNSSRTPVDIESKLGDDGDPVSYPTLYRSLAGSLQYLTFTRLDISYAVQQVCLHMHDPREPHFLALKRILRYVRSTLDYGLQLYSSSVTSLVTYSDADWAGCPTTR
ncbi:ribonuclease H-like domain-containing protein, partial [Tanacetum coccineum]